MFVIVDTETEGLENPQKLWLVVCKEVESGQTHIFRNLHEDAPGRATLANLLGQAQAVIGHNIIGFDRSVLHRIANVPLRDNQIIDTLVVSRLLNQAVAGGHSLAAIGERLGFPKTEFSDFSQYSEEMERYCINDVEVTYRYYLKVKPFIFSPKWRDSLRLEHDIAILGEEMHANGFAFDMPKAQAMHQEILSKLASLDGELDKAFPPKPKFIKEITPRETAQGTLHRGDFRWLESADLTPFSPGVSFSRIEFEPFNAGSPKQIVERLNEAGWKPYEKTKGHLQAERSGDDERLDHYRTYGWSVSENNLATLSKDAPEAARKLVQRLLLDSRRSTLEEWFKAYSESTGRIHGRFRHIGAWTHRMSHNSPNMANIPAGESPYATEMRSLWRVSDGNWLVGVDADGIQLRILAHYMNDKGFTEALINGRKEDGTDAHTLNQRALGSVCRSRDTAKTFIYAWLLGAGNRKISEILDCSPEEARVAVASFTAAYPGLKALKEVVIPRDAARGFFYGLDGRAVLCDSEHLMLAGYLQNGEAVVMKKANLLWREELKSRGILPHIKQVNFVHDEWQTEVSGDYELAKDIAQIQSKSIKKAGELLGVRCPLEGSFLNSHKQLSIGHNWAETH